MNLLQLGEGERITAVLADSEVARHLGTEVGSALVSCLISAEEAGNDDLRPLREKVADLAAGVRRTGR